MHRKVYIITAEVEKRMGTEVGNYMEIKMFSTLALVFTLFSPEAWSGAAVERMLMRGNARIPFKNLFTIVALLPS